MQLESRGLQWGEMRIFRHSDSPPFDHVDKQFLTLFNTSIGLGAETTGRPAVYIET